MAERSSLIQQVSSITGCNHYQAQTVLERSNWNAERAMNSYFDDPPPERPAVNTTIAPFLGAPHDSAAVSWDVPNNPAYAPPPGPPPASNPNWGANNKDVIDLTNDGDPDEDLRRAMAASLQDHQSQQAYRPPAAPSSTVGDLGMSEDEQLRQALEASVQSHHDLLQSTGSGACSPALPQHLEMNPETRRIPGAPIAMVAPFASLQVAAAVLQALYAAPPARRAFLASRPVDTRGTDLSNYWKGTSPTDPSFEAASQSPLDVHFDLTRRIQTLFAFATLSQRPLCVVKDVTALMPSEIVARGADHTSSARVASLCHEFLVENFSKHVSAVTDMILSAPSAAAVSTDALWMTDALFLSSGAAALTIPASSPLNGSSADHSPPIIEQRRSFIQLRHDSVNSDTYSCLRAALASDGEGALLTQPAHVISMGIDHALPSCNAPSAFTIQERIHLDSLMWDRRRGQRLDAELQGLETIRLESMCSDLEARKRKLLGDGGRVTQELFSGAKRYFEQIAESDGQDEVRSASIAEAAPQIDKIVQAIEADLAATDDLIATIKQRVDAKRAMVKQRATREAQNPEWQQMAYDLCAVLLYDAGQVIALVQERGKWWKVSGGTATQVAKEDVVMGREQDPSLQVFWLVYARAEDKVEQQESDKVIETLIGEPVKVAVADDNLTYESELLSLIRSDAASPSSTDVDVAAEEQHETEQDGQGTVDTVRDVPMTAIDATRSSDSV